MKQYSKQFLCIILIIALFLEMPIFSISAHTESNEDYNVQILAIANEFASNIKKASSYSEIECVSWKATYELLTIFGYKIDSHNVMKDTFAELSDSTRREASTAYDEEGKIANYAISCATLMPLILPFVDTDSKYKNERDAVFREFKNNVNDIPSIEQLTAVCVDAFLKYLEIACRAMDTYGLWTGFVDSVMDSYRSGCAIAVDSVDKKLVAESIIVYLLLVMANLLDEDSQFDGGISNIVDSWMGNTGKSAVQDCAYNMVASAQLMSYIAMSVK